MTLVHKGEIKSDNFFSLPMLSLFTPLRSEGTTPEPLVELVKEETEDTRAQPPLKFFDDQCGCN